MSSTRLFWRIFGLLVVLYVTLAIGLILFVVSRQRVMVDQAMADRLHEIARLVAEQIQDDQPESLQTFVDSLPKAIEERLTIIQLDGTVIADSAQDPAEMDNHANRPEVRSARDSGFGFARRNSTTLDQGMLYVCIFVPVKGLDSSGESADEATSVAESTFLPADGLLIRASKPTVEIDQQVRGINRSLWLFALSLATLAALATWLLTRRVIEPLSKITEAANAIARGDYRTAINVNRHVSDWGTVASAFGKMQNELQEREDALKANSRRLGTVLASMTEGVIAVSDDGEIRFSNRAALRLLNIEHNGKIDGRSIFEVLRVPIVKRTLEEVWQLGESKRCEFETRGEPRRILLMRISKLPDQASQGLVCVLHDMTEIRQLETMRRDFVANVSHELKTPLSSIKAYAETLKLGAINDQKRNIEFVERIESQADRLHQLILDLLHLARVESGKTFYEMVAINVSNVLDASIDSFRRLAESREVEIHVDCDSSMRVVADSEGLRAVADNLISNAVRYTQPNGSVTVKCYQEEDYGVIEVADTGIGIAPEHQQRVFERFYRVDKARSSDLGGTGLGLSIVKHLCNSFGGNVTLESKVGRGTTFYVRLPLED